MPVFNLFIWWMVEMDRAMGFGIPIKTKNENPLLCSN